jgi:hypothetical protein
MAGWRRFFLKADFPDQNLRTYDDTGWTMGLMSHCEVKRYDKAILDAGVSRSTASISKERRRR